MSLLEELKTKRQDAVEMVAGVDLDIEATRATLADEQRIRAHWVQKIADLDRAIAALSPAPSEGDALAEVEIPEGFTVYTAGYSVRPADDVVVEVIRHNGERAIGTVAEVGVPHYHGDDFSEILKTSIRAYRVLPIEPAPDAGEVEVDEEAELVLAFEQGRQAYHEGSPINPYALETPNAERWHDGFVSEAEKCRAEAASKAERAAEAKRESVDDGEAMRMAHSILPGSGATFKTDEEIRESVRPHASDCARNNEPAYPAGKCDCTLRLKWTRYSEIAPKSPDELAGYEVQSFYSPEVGEWVYRHYPIAVAAGVDPLAITIASSSQHAEESARAQDLAPLFPPEPPQAATPESLRAGGIVDSEASWWARKLAKEPA